MSSFIRALPSSYTLADIICAFHLQQVGSIVNDALGSQKPNCVYLTTDGEIGYLHPYVGDDHLRAVRARAWVQACTQIWQGTQLTVSYGNDYWNSATLPEEDAEERYLIACTYAHVDTLGYTHRFETIAGVYRSKPKKGKEKRRREVEDDVDSVNIPQEGTTTSGISHARFVRRGTPIRCASWSGSDREHCAPTDLCL
jgi:hypothetical protein